MKFRSSDQQDYNRIAEWIDRDIFHFGKMTPEYWLPCPEALYSFCLEDDQGPVLYLRVDKEGDLFRFHMQFAPEEQVSRLRTAKALFKIFDPLVSEFKKEGKGIIFKSTNDPLIRFMERKGFVSCGNDDYLLQWES